MIGISDSKMFYIQTEKLDKMVELLSESNAGYTILKTESGHTKNAKLNKGFILNDLNEIYNDTPIKTIIFELKSRVI